MFIFGFNEAAAYSRGKHLDREQLFWAWRTLQ